MFTRKVYYLALTILVSMLFVEIKAVLACEICTIPRLGRQEKLVATEDSDSKWFFEFLAEEQNWDEWEPTEAHLLHEDGHDVHNKTSEYFYHFTLGRALNKNVAITVEIPYIIRKSLGVADGKVGNKDKSEGVGDLNLMASYRAIKKDNSAVSIVGGVKFPTGETDDKDLAGDKFEPELQPGSGSYDFLLGGIFEHQIDRVIVKGNVTYSFKNEGDQNFEFGDLFSTSLFVDYILNPDSKSFRTKAGIDINYQYAQKDEANGVKDLDSGGRTIFVGPTLTVDASNNISFFANVLFPALQNLGGVHQEMDYVWTVGGKIEF